jgi:cytosine/adenosine deaminase-related metal-dependent hydrolase
MATKHWDGRTALRVGALADFVTVGLQGDRLSGIAAASLATAVVLAATAADVHHVVVNGEVVVRDGDTTRRPRKRL